MMSQADFWGLVLAGCEDKRLPDPLKGRNYL
jgi:hypothetical protein